MKGFTARISIAFACLALGACGGKPVPAPSRPEALAAPREQLDRIVQRYWDAYLEQNPLLASSSGNHRYDDRLGNPIALQSLADSLALERRALAEVLAIPPPTADSAGLLTYEMFKRGRELAIEGYQFPMELLPVNPFAGMFLDFARLGSGTGSQPFKTSRDYANWLARIDDYVIWTRQAIANMRDGVRRGYTLPRELVEETLPLLAALGADTPANPFYLPVGLIPPDMGAADREGLRQRLESAVRTKILPAYRDLHAFLQTEYLPVARSGAALSDLPLGDAWYAHLLRAQTGSAQTPAEINRIGLAEVERIHARIQALLAEMGFAGSAQNYVEQLRQEPRFALPSNEALLDAYRELQTRVTAASASALAPPPAPAVEIRAMEPFAESLAPAIVYEGAVPNGGLPAVLRVNTFDLPSRAGFEIAALFLNGAVPGHHTQYVAQRDQASLPNFRRFGQQGAFVEGWSLYAESLGEELGLYREPGAKFGDLLHELRCAAALVVDTGLHSRAWTRRRALEYLHAQTSIDERSAALLVDRALALPGQAVAATIGKLQIQELRQRAQQRLGARFDIRAFHAEVLEAGAMPLDLLADRVALWLEKTVMEPPRPVPTP
jgi:uncharacterized protein (DUF885 family)